MNVIGFDFGTTNSLLSSIEGGRPRLFLDEERRPIPSVVGYEGTGVIVGRQAKDRLAEAGLGVHGNIVRSPKMYLGDEGVVVGGVERSPVDLVATVVGHVLGVARTQRLGQVDASVVTIPVGMPGYGRRALRAAFLKSGLRIHQFVHEPLAALYGYFRKQGLEEMRRQYEGRYLLVFDWGGGTLDLTLCRLWRGMLLQIANDGTDDVGGDVFDECIMNELLQRVTNARGGDSAPQPGGKERLLERCERAKIDLTDAERAVIYVEGFFSGGADQDFEYLLPRTELESIVVPLLEKGFGRIEAILQRANVDRGQIALCLATGGMANLPAVERRLNEWFGPARVRIPDSTATLIAEGAAWIAHDRVELELARNVELRLARDSWLPLIKAGTPMPTFGEIKRSEFELFCVDPRDGVAKFEFASPLRPEAKVLRSDPREHLELLTVGVDDSAKAFKERINLYVSVDENLILTARARSSVAEDEDVAELHDLEFGLSFVSGSTQSSSEDAEGSEFDASIRGGSRNHGGGALNIRSNVALDEDLSLVPGDFLYSYDRGSFNRIRNPPEYQEAEYVYYKPCLSCGQVYHPGGRCRS